MSTETSTETSTEGEIAMTGTQAAERWWIATGLLATGGEKVLGPFVSRELALQVRSYMERCRHADGDLRTYWVDAED